ncbi:MAG TPA: DUF2569 family protein [Candidatus Angelobacter sp.]|nr:DUF2569 family protein [Candidatus Angelobacter sp.]
MFCARCGEQIPDTSDICPVCGREANVKLAVAPASAAPAPALDPSSAAPIIPIRKDLQGVGGWLLFFCIALVILGPVWLLSEVNSAAGSDLLGMVLEIAQIAFGVVVGIFVWNVRQVAFTLLWIYFGVTTVYSLLAIIGSIELTNEGQGEPMTFVYSIRSLIYVVVWFLYFRKSQRVRATFGRNL